MICIQTDSNLNQEFIFYFLLIIIIILVDYFYEIIFFFFFYYINIKGLVSIHCQNNVDIELFYLSNLILLKKFKVN